MKSASGALVRYQASTPCGTRILSPRRTQPHSERALGAARGQSRVGETYGLSSTRRSNFPMVAKLPYSTLRLQLECLFFAVGFLIFGAFALRRFCGAAFSKALRAHTTATV